MCDKSRFGQIGRFDGTLVETYSKPASADKALAAPKTTGTAISNDRLQSGVEPKLKA